MDVQTLKNKYRGYTLQAVAVRVAHDKFVWDGNARKPEGENRDLVTFGHQTADDVYAALKRNIDYWNDPDWTRNIKAAQEQIKYQDAELAAQRARCEALEEALSSLLIKDEYGVWVRSDGELAKQAAALLEGAE